MIKGSDNISRSVVSNQEGVHPDLDEVVMKYLQSGFKRPIAEHTLAAFQGIQKRVTDDGRPLILDSGCGVGESSINLARLHPGCLVVGVDQSEHRLSKNGAYLQDTGHRDLENLILVRADCIDFWRLAVDAGWELHKHYILYPNPWPKKIHLKRRWHGHPVFSSVLRLGGDIELRSNWQVYVAEFAQALELLGYSLRQHGELLGEAGNLAPIERKYALSGQRLFSLQASLNK